MLPSLATLTLQAQGQGWSPIPGRPAATPVQVLHEAVQALRHCVACHAAAAPRWPPGIPAAHDMMTYNIHDISMMIMIISAMIMLIIIGV